MTVSQPRPLGNMESDETSKETPENPLTTEPTATTDSTENEVLKDAETRRREASKLRARRNRKRKKEETENLENHIKLLTVRNMDLERQLEVMTVQLIGAEEKIKTLEKLLSDALKAGVRNQELKHPSCLLTTDSHCSCPFKFNIIQSHAQQMSETYIRNHGLNNMNEQHYALYPMNIGSYGALPNGSSIIPAGLTGLASYADLNRNAMLMQAITEQQSYRSQQHMEQMYNDSKPQHEEHI